LFQAGGCAIWKDVSWERAVSNRWERGHQPFSTWPPKVSQLPNPRADTCRPELPRRR
jgi:hypothetical protein